MGHRRIVLTEHGGPQFLDVPKVEIEARQAQERVLSRVGQGKIVLNWEL